MAKALVQLLQKQFPESILETHDQHGDETVVVKASDWHAIAEFLKDNSATGMDMLTDLTAVDYPARQPRFEVVAHLYSLTKGHRLRLKARVGDSEGKSAEIDSVSDLWGSANWMERECFDMFGVRFVNHPDLRRILMYPEFEGHPLRKDYPASKIQPLVPYREGVANQKLPPFDWTEGMSFGRQSHDALALGEEGQGQQEDRELFPEGLPQERGGEAN